MQNVNLFLEKGQDLKISEELENHSIFESTVSPETRALVQQVIGDYLSMLMNFTND